ncbi:hypothetical protein [Patulibacter sp.]|uniref:hypothetical protein n=1 Tax=Patulibacter sp. TaxID=1912859 RepID=UPI0027167619|nr:hypothetical protein [Patulibacter sp.]MDO9406953.1 hypothetical protein [Patulibacter sp.]
MRPPLLSAATALVLLAGTATAAADTTPTRAEFESRVTRLLTDRHGADFTDAAVRYVACPAAQLSHDRNYGSQQDCRYEFGSRSRRTAGGISFFDDFGGGGEFRPSPATRATFDTAPRACTGSRLRAGFADPGWTLRSLRATADDPYSCRTSGQLLDHLAATTRSSSRLPRHRTIRLSDAGPGYPTLDDWDCSRTGARSQTVTCRNGLGHRITARLEPTD